LDQRTPFSEDESQAGRSLEPWISEHAALTASLRSGSREFAEGLDEPRAALALMRTDRLGAAVLDRRGEVMFSNARFDQAEARRLIEAGLVAEVLAGGPTRIDLPGEVAGATGRTVMAYGAVAQARGWIMPEAARAAAEQPEAAVVILAVGAASAGDVLAEVCGAFGLTDLQTRVAVGLVRTGDMRGAAKEAQVTYETARKSVAEAMRRVGATRLPAFIERLVRLSFGVWPQGPEGAAILSDIWGLSERQAVLALRLSQGMTRAEAAAASGMSLATAKKQLDIVFAALGVHTAGALARTVTEARALALLTDATQGEAHADEAVLEPLGLFHREDGGQVAYSDHGPRSGRPVLILHSTTTSRPAPSVLVAALQAEGFRPLTLDRPGFGLTDPPADRAAHRADPFGAACDDIARLCARLKIARIDILARGGAQVAVAMAGRNPGLMGRVLLVNPAPPAGVSSRRRGPIGAVQEAFHRHPDLIEPLARLLTGHLSLAGARRLMNRSLESSPLDMAVMADARNFSDYYRAFRMFATGRLSGYVAEHVALAGWTAPPLEGAAHWRVLLGRHDFLYEPERTHAFWSETLPGARLAFVEDGARFVVHSHAGLVARTLAQAPDPGAPLRAG
jgi:pimeloyl-ACP methyl ester carboxylesterase/DNA-binding NarL/FixJ family response regulator